MYYRRVTVFFALVFFLSFMITMAESWGILGRIFLTIVWIVSSPFGDDDRVYFQMLMGIASAYAIWKTLQWVFKLRPEGERHYLTPIDSE